MSVVTRLHSGSEKDSLYNITAQSDVTAKFWNGQLIQLKYKMNNDDGKRAIVTDAILEAA